VRAAGGRSGSPGLLSVEHRFVERNRTVYLRATVDRLEAERRFAQRLRQEDRLARRLDRLERAMLAVPAMWHAISFNEQIELNRHYRTFATVWSAISDDQLPGCTQLARSGAQHANATAIGQAHGDLEGAIREIRRQLDDVVTGVKRDRVTGRTAPLP
jgi:hypothetical protein